MFSGPAGKFPSAVVRPLLFLLFSCKITVARYGKKRRETAVTDTVDQARRIDACDVLIVGAGLVGAAVASSLVNEGLEVAVLEAQEAAGGATALSPGLALTGLSMPYVQAVERWGRQTARELWQLTLENRARLQALAQRMGLSVESTGSLLLATDQTDATRLRASAELLDADGFAVRFEAADPLDRGFAAALHAPDDLVVDPVALTRRIFETFSIPIHPHTQVHAFEPSGDDVLVWARGRVVRASTVVLAVNAYAALLDGYFRNKIVPASGCVLTTHPLDGQLIVPAGSVGPFSFRQYPDGHMLFAAWRSEYETPAASAQGDNLQVALARFIGRHFAGSQLVRRETTVMGGSRDGLPILGALPHLPQVYFALGFGGCGMSLAFSAAELLAGFILRGAEPPLFSARRLE